jgi:hypothetical protein
MKTGLLNQIIAAHGGDERRGRVRQLNLRAAGKLLCLRRIGSSFGRSSQTHRAACPQVASGWFFDVA